MALMAYFYDVTGFGVTLFDPKHAPLLSYPPEEASFCGQMRRISAFDEACRKDAACGFAECKKCRDVVIFRCHAGLLGAIAPIGEKDNIVGYLFVCQMSDHRDKDWFYEQLQRVCAEYGAVADLQALILKIKYRTSKQLRVAQKLLELCATYIQCKELVRLRPKSLIDRIGEYVERHLQEDVTVDTLCDAFGISRTGLYNAMRQTDSGGVAAFIRQKRIDRAKQLISTRKMPLTEVAAAVGFLDYNHFSRVFKSTFGISPKKMQKHYHQEQ